MFPYTKGRQSREILMLIPVRDNDVEKALRTLKRKLQKEGYFGDIKKKSFHEKPSQKRKRKQKEAERRRLKRR